jgi:lipoic acid synthetase
MLNEGRIPKPTWLKARIPSGRQYFKIKRDLESKGLHTICQSARCPNIDECWNHNHATFLIMGDICSRNCLFCSVKHGTPRPLDADEPRRILEMVNILKLKYAVITSVTRDDLEDGGSRHFARIIKILKQHRPDLKIEVLIPDFKGDPQAVDVVLDAQPAVLNHNVETVKRLYEKVNRHPASYQSSLKVLKHSSDRGMITKSGIMVGLGETPGELQELFGHLTERGVRLLTIGQYCQPGRENVKVERFYNPDEFAALKESALSSGFTAVESGPFVRSSYHAQEMYEKAARPYEG